MLDNVPLESGTPLYRKAPSFDEEKYKGAFEYVKE
jgi:hypothetical protein